MCKHVAAVLLKYIYDRSRSVTEVAAPDVPMVRNTSSSLMELLNQYPEETPAVLQAGAGSVSLLPELRCSDSDLPDAIQASFRIQKGGQRPYVIRYLLDFVTHG